MVIVDNSVIKRDFADIRVGGVFKMEYEEGSNPDYCMRVPEFFDQPSQERFNAIDLEDGTWCYFKGYEQVIPYDAVLHLDH